MPRQRDKSGKQQKNQRREKKAKPPTARDLMKLEIADELGLLQKVKSVGWVGLTAQEAGTIGGVMSHRLRKRPDAASAEKQPTAIDVGRNTPATGELPSGR